MRPRRHHSWQVKQDFPTALANGPLQFVAYFIAVYDSLIALDPKRSGSLKG